MEEPEILKIYPWKGLSVLKDKYGVFVDFNEKLYTGWSIQNAYNNPFKLGEEFGSFLYGGDKEINFDIEQNFKKECEQPHVIDFAKTGRIKPLDKKELELFVHGLNKGYRGINTKAYVWVTDVLIVENGEITDKVKDNRLNFRICPTGESNKYIQELNISKDLKLDEDFRRTRGRGWITLEPEEISTDPPPGYMPDVRGEVERSVKHGEVDLIKLVKGMPISEPR